MNQDFSKKKLLSVIHSIDGWLSEREALLLYELAGNVPAFGQIVEIVSYKGKSTIALSFGAQHKKREGSVWAVDPHEGVISHNDHNKKNTFSEFQKNIHDTGLEETVRQKKQRKNGKNPLDCYS
jgi:hypothetical protein